MTNFQTTLLGTILFAPKISMWRSRLVQRRLEMNTASQLITQFNKGVVIYSVTTTSFQKVNRLCLEVGVVIVGVVIIGDSECGGSGCGDSGCGVVGVV